jgi:glycosyltransferase involved in cell wall biosynthesis
MSKQSVLRMGYLISKYPAVSHTFILREILALRERGIEIDVASINDSGDRLAMTEIEKGEADRTFYVKRAGAVGAAKALLSGAFAQPLRSLSGVQAAFRLGALDPKRTVLCLFYLTEAFILADWLRRRSLNHLHVHFATPAATVALLLSKIAPVTFSMMVHGPDEFYDVSGYYLAEKISAARFVVCISHFAQSQVMKLSDGAQWSKFDIARLGVDTNHFVPRTPTPSTGIFEILCVGRLVQTKGQRILIQAVSLLAEQGRPVMLRLVGDGPDRADLERTVQKSGLKENIRLEGAVNQDRIQEFYRRADVFALASFAEGIPVVLMEAMAMEIPCVSTSINGIPELIRDGEDGFLVAPSDVEGLATAIVRLMDDTGMRERVGKAGRLRVVKDYEIGASADHLVTVFQRRLGQTN